MFHSVAKTSFHKTH